MSSIPGYTLEDYIMWEVNITVDDLSDANHSLGIAESLGNITRRSHLTKDEFNDIVLLWEPYRDSVESTLGGFDADQQSWRDYAGYCFDYIPPSLLETTSNKIIALTQQPTEIST